MKTLFQAVSALKGNLNNAYRLSGRENYLYYCTSDNTWLCTMSTVFNDSYELIGTTANFKVLLEDMEYNFDKCKVSDICKYQKGKKELLKPVSVFTQEMFDNNMLPRVGMKCQSSIGIVTLLLPIDSTGFGVVKVDGEYVIICQSELKPLKV